MKYFYITGLITDETLDDFIDLINETTDPIDILLDSYGGHVHAGDMFIHIINSDVTRFTLTVNRAVFSTAFSIFARSKCPRIVLPGTQGMLHQATVEYDTTTNGIATIKPSERARDKFIYDNTLSLLLQLKPDDKSVRKYKKGEHIYFTTEELEEIIKRIDL